MDSQQSYWTAESNETETTITYFLPGEADSNAFVSVEKESGEDILVVSVPGRKDGFSNSTIKKFHFFPNEIPQRISWVMKDGVLTIRIPKIAG